MCGIAGYLGAFDREALERMNAAQQHRGPDDAGIYVHPECGLGMAHRRLSIIDLSEAGHQPMHSADGRVTITYNGEIYNYRELQRDLEESGWSFRSASDTEVLLNLYLRDGHAMLDRLNGIFAFALWDHQRQELLVVRDGVGVKPLYYSETGQGFVFASELKALLQCDAVSRQLDPLAIQHYLTYLWCPAPRTMLAGVRKLRPGHAMRVTRDGVVREWQYYDLPRQGHRLDLTDDEAARRVRAAVAVAVERQLVADVPVGAFLSGGLDSSAIVACASRALGNRAVPCFTIGFTDDAMVREGFAEDLPYARRVAQQLGAELHTIQVGPEMAERLEGMIYHLDEPQADPAPINVWFISQLARRHGIKVLLSGAGGDDIFAGYRRHYAVLRERTWSWLPAPARHALGAVARRLPTDHPHARRLRKGFQYAALDGDRRTASYYAWIAPSAVQGLYGPAIRGALAGTDPLEPLIETLGALPEGLSPLDRMLYLEGKHFLADHNLNYTDKMGMAEGVEIRVPLLDPDLITLAAGLDDRQKYRGADGKWVFKRAMEPLLPREVIYRPKTGFGAPVRSWLRGPLRPLLEDLLSRDSLRRRGLFDPTGVHDLIERDRAGRIDGAYTILALLCIELWCRIFMESRQPAAVTG